MIFLFRLYFVAAVGWELPDSSRGKKRKKTETINENGKVTTDTAEIQRIIRDYYQ